MLFVENSDSLFEVYASQSSCDFTSQTSHSDGHLDGDSAGRHIDEHADRP